MKKLEQIRDEMTNEYVNRHESWCDTQNNISERCNCLASGYIEQIEDLRADVNRLLNHLEAATAFYDTPALRAWTLTQNRKLWEMELAEFREKYPKESK
jgi:hypothetical protein